MTISWYGQSCFKIETRQATLAIDPFFKDIGLTPPRFRADLLLISHEHPDHSNTQAIGGEPLIIRGPGEYERKGVEIRGIPTFHDAKAGQERGPNTSYRLRSEDITLLHFGDFGESGLRPETMEAAGNIDILIIPVGGTYTIGPKDAAAIVKTIEPALVIPMHYKIAGLKFPLAGVETFLKEMEVKATEPVAKLSVKKKDLKPGEARVILLHPLAV